MAAQRLRVRVQHRVTLPSCARHISPKKSQKKAKKWPKRVENHTVARQLGEDLHNLSPQVIRGVLPDVPKDESNKRLRYVVERGEGIENGLKLPHHEAKHAADWCG